MMNYRILSRITALVGALVVFAALATSAQAASVAPAAAKLAAEKSVVTKVAAAANPQAAFQSLSPSEQALYADSLTNLTGTTIASGGGSLPATGVAAAGGCWYHYQFDSWSDLGIHDGDTWMQLNWCSNGPRITSYHISNDGGRGVNGSTYKGVQGRGYLNVGWEVRAYDEFHFNFFGYLDAYPCMQIRGGHTGLYSQGRTCNLN